MPNETKREKQPTDPSATGKKQGDARQADEAEEKGKVTRAW